MKKLNLKGPPEKIIDPGRLEALFATGLSMKEVAREMSVAYDSLSRKINNSTSLMAARSRGMRKSKGE